MLSMLVTTKVKVNRLCSVLKTFSKIFLLSEGRGCCARATLLLLDHNVSPRWPPIHSGLGRGAIVSAIGP